MKFKGFKFSDLLPGSGKRQFEADKQEFMSAVARKSEEMAQTEIHKGSIKAALRYLVRADKIDGRMHDLAERGLFEFVQASPRRTEPEMSAEFIEEIAAEYARAREGDKSNEGTTHQVDMRDALKAAVANLPKRLAREKAFKDNYPERYSALDASYTEIAAIVNGADLHPELKRFINDELRRNLEKEAEEMPEETAPQDPVARYKCFIAYCIRNIIPQSAQLFLPVGISKDEWRRYAQEFYPRVLEWAGEYAMEKGFSLDEQK